MIRVDFLPYKYQTTNGFSKPNLANREDKYRCKNEKKCHDANFSDPASDQNVNVKASIASNIY